MVFDCVLDVRGSPRMYSAPTRHPAAGVSVNITSLLWFLCSRSR